MYILQTLIIIISQESIIKIHLTAPVFKSYLSKCINENMLTPALLLLCSSSFKQLSAWSSEIDNNICFWLGQSLPLFFLMPLSLHSPRWIQQRCNMLTDIFTGIMTAFWWLFRLYCMIWIEWKSEEFKLNCFMMYRIFLVHLILNCLPCEVWSTAQAWGQSKCDTLFFFIFPPNNTLNTHF